jgi:hypothetical protein
MTPGDLKDELRKSLSLPQVYRLMALEQVEMDRRVAENRASNVVHLKTGAARCGKIRLEPGTRRRLAG